MPPSAVPRFYLYGEPHRAVDRGFVHIEHLDDRSRPSEWTIQPHAHADLVQLLAIAQGGGTMRVEDAVFAFDAPAILLVPAGVVHGFAWTSESAGSVLTLAQSYLADLDQRYPGLATVFQNARVMILDGEARSATEAALALLMRELGWAAPGHLAAVDAALLAILVAVLRAQSSGTDATATSPGEPSAPGQHALVARFRARIDDRFRLRESIADHAAALGTSESRLRDACARVAATAPAAMLDQRTMLEARRALLYSNLSVAEIAYATGFADPAYFTRFFTRHAGQSPRAFRRERS